MIHPGRLNRVIKIAKMVETAPDANGDTAIVTGATYTFRAELVENATTGTNEAPGIRATDALVFRTYFADVVAERDTLEYRGQVYRITKLSEIGYRVGLEIHAEAVS